MQKVAKLVLSLLVLCASSNDARPQVATHFTAGISKPPLSITVGPDGNLWFTESDRIGRITPAGVVTEFTAGISTGAGNPSLGLVTAGPDGNVWFTEVGFLPLNIPSRVARITPRGEVTEFTDGLALADLAGITAGPDRAIWFTQSAGPGSNMVGRMTVSGQVTLFPIDAVSDARIGFMTAGTDGNLWFIFSPTSISPGQLARIGRITPAGVTTEFTAAQSPYANSLTAGPDGNVWFTDGFGFHIGRITPLGTIAEFSAGMGSHLSSITAGADGNLWFTESFANRIGRITTNGIISQFDTGIAIAGTERVQLFDITHGPDGNLWFTYSVIDGYPAPRDLRWGIGRMTTGAPTRPRVFERLEVVSGDRQITIDSITPAAPFVVRALDAAGNPVADVPLLIGPASAFGGPILVDEFGFRGFNASGFADYLSFETPKYITKTDTNGIATASGPYWDEAPTAFVVGARQWPGPADVQAFFSIVTTKSAPPGDPSVVVEYFHAPTGHYLNTLLQDEIDLLDGGQFVGWSRSIGSFIAYAREAGAPAEAVPVCRFFSSRYTAHFHTADATECQAVVDRWPDVWTLETPTAFYIFEPDKATGQCASGLQPVYRLYSTRNGPNHRYVTDRALRDAMVQAGWTAEGFGPDAVMLCTPK